MFPLRVVRLDALKIKKWAFALLSNVARVADSSARATVRGWSNGPAQDELPGLI